MGSLIDVLAKKYNLGTASRAKVFFGLDELSVLFDALRLEENVQNTFQHFIAWQMGLNIGPRPSSLGEDPFWPGLFMAWEDIVYYRIHDNKEAGKVMVEVTLRHMKGEKGLSKTTIISPTFTFYPVSNSQNLVGDLTISLVILGIKRGRLPFKDYKDVERCTERIIPVNHDMDKQPVFLKPQGEKLSDEPLSCSAFTPKLKSACEKVSELWDRT